MSFLLCVKLTNNRGVSFQNKVALLELMKFTKQSPVVEITDEEYDSVFSKINQSLTNVGYALSKEKVHFISIIQEE